ncbi:MAG: SDR family oxidoreductase [Rhodospirillales bacterium]
MIKRTTLISGGTKGIGRAAADMELEDGHTVIALARNEDPNFPGICYKVDLFDRKNTAEVMQKIVSEHKVDKVVHAAGIANPQLIETVTLEQFDQVIELNLRASIQIVQAVLPHMRDRKWGRIVNISSRAALGRVTRTSYGAAKSGMYGMTRSWALELALDGITANVVAPGPTLTEMLKFNNPDLAAFAAEVPMKRLAEPREIGSMIHYFLSEDASFVTGQVIYVDGGLSVGMVHL